LHTLHGLGRQIPSTQLFKYAYALVSVTLENHRDIVNQPGSVAGRLLWQASIRSCQIVEKAFQPPAHLGSPNQTLGHWMTLSALCVAVGRGTGEPGHQLPYLGWSDPSTELHSFGGPIAPHDGKDAVLDADDGAGDRLSAGSRGLYQYPQCRPLGAISPRQDHYVGAIRKGTRHRPARCSDPIAVQAHRHPLSTSLPDEGHSSGRLTINHTREGPSCFARVGILTTLTGPARAGIHITLVRLA
jgi:hypothetical protein